MKTTKRFPLLLVVVTLIALLSLTACNGYSPVKGSLVMGENYLLQSGDTLNDDLTVMGGNATLENGSTVNGDVAVMGGSISIDGTVNGDISVMGGSVQLEDNAKIHGSISQIGGSVDRAKGAVVDGSMNRTTGPSVNVPPIPAVPNVPNFRAPRVDLGGIFEPFMAIFRALALAALAILVFMFAGRPMSRVGQAVLAAPVISGGIGLLSVIVLPALLIIMGITIILLPVSLLGLLLVVIALMFGWMALGLLLGQRLAQGLHMNWSDPLSAGIGTLILTLLSSIFNVIPCVGWLASFVIGIIGLGAVIVTRFGTQNYSPSSGPGGFRPTSAYGVPPTPPQPPAGPSAPQPDQSTNQSSYAPGYYYAPRVVTPDQASSTFGVEPAQSETAPNLDFLNSDFGNTQKPAGDPADENKQDNQPPAVDL